jgi:hypothetical protein
VKTLAIIVAVLFAFGLIWAVNEDRRALRVDRTKRNPQPPEGDQG